MRLLLICLLGLLIACSDPKPAGAKTDWPDLASTASPDWGYTLNNAVRVADNAVAGNLGVTFFGGITEYKLVEQAEGEYQGRYLLFMTRNKGNNTLLAVMLPLFDETKDVAALDDEQPQWRVVIIKHNGKEL